MLQDFPKASQRDLRTAFPNDGSGVSRHLIHLPALFVYDFMAFYFLEVTGSPNWGVNEWTWNSDGAPVDLSLFQYTEEGYWTYPSTSIMLRFDIDYGGSPSSWTKISMYSVLPNSESAPPTCYRGLFCCPK